MSWVDWVTWSGVVVLAILFVRVLLQRRAAKQPTFESPTDTNVADARQGEIVRIHGRIRQIGGPLHGAETLLAPRSRRSRGDLKRLRNRYRGERLWIDDGTGIALVPLRGTRVQIEEAHHVPVGGALAETRRVRALLSDRGFADKHRAASDSLTDLLETMLQEGDPVEVRGKANWIRTPARALEHAPHKLLRLEAWAAEPVVVVKMPS